MNRRNFFRTVLGAVAGTAIARFLPQSWTRTTPFTMMNEASRKVNLREIWVDNHREIWVNGTLLDREPSLYWHGKPPFVEFKYPSIPVLEKEQI